MTRSLLPLLLCSLFALPALAGDKDQKTDDGWISLFDGKTLKGWKIIENPESWQVKDGMLVGSGDRSHIFTEKEYVDCEIKADVMTTEGSNSGMYFRTKAEGGWPTGYEAQVNNTHPDPRKTGSLYAIKDVHEQLAQDNEFWTQHIIVKGNHIIIKVNGKVAVDYVDEEHRYKKGHLAFQQHDPKSVVYYKNIMVKPLGDSAE